MKGKVFVSSLDKSGGFLFGPELRAPKGNPVVGGNKWLVPVGKGKGKEDEEAIGLASSDADGRPQQGKDLSHNGDKVDQKRRHVDHGEQETKQQYMDVETGAPKNREGRATTPACKAIRRGAGRCTTGGSLQNPPPGILF
ncbi:unnamed protein product [Cuscuta epithymum]|uniref:Uncharacterized protein n=1 Tax=Cuscuta epithymum TaxID=186058 RepID=A0AAV0FBL0_9ASTE|nr:unnamed protein product [Cuscuta epithymum]